MEFAPKNLIATVAVLAAGLQGASANEVATGQRQVEQRPAVQLGLEPITITDRTGEAEVVSGILTLTEDVSQAVSDSEDSVAEWTLADHHERWIEHLRNVVDDFDGTGAERPNEASIELTDRILAHARDLELSVNRAVESAANGVFIYFKTPGKYAHIEVFNDGGIIVAWKSAGGPLYVEETQPDSILDSVAKVHEFLIS